MVVLLLGLASGNGAYVVLLLSINDMEVIQDIPPEAELAESDVATYASLNNDLNGTKADQEADVPGLHNLAVAIIDYKIFSLVRKSILNISTHTICYVCACHKVINGNDKRFFVL